MGAILYSDDQLLIAPNMELMLAEVEKFAEESNIKVSTDPDPDKSNSKLIFICGRQTGLAKPSLLLCALPALSPGSPLTPTSDTSCSSRGT
jgi:hypothetical protein